MTLKKRMWSNRVHYEVEEEIVRTPLGIENTGHATFIRNRLNEVFGSVSG